jgi:hypothetical protein
VSVPWYKSARSTDKIDLLTISSQLKSLCHNIQLAKVVQEGSISCSLIGYT